MIRVTRELLERLPKTDLHVHLDGSLRPDTMIDLAREQGKTLPTWDADELRDYMHVDDARNLVDYLARFDTTLALMQTPEAMERIAYEMAVDAAIENVRYMEVRYCPALHTSEGMTLDEAVEAPLRGLLRAEKEFGIRTALIICALRHLPPEVAEEMSDLAIAWKGRGVVAFDLAGGEDGNPAVNFKSAFDKAARANLAITLHAGEAAGAESIAQAIHECHARRIGHGTRLYEDAELMQYVNDFRIPLEINLTSNIQTHAADDFASHPLRRYYDEGLVLTLNTDNRLMSATTVTEEYWRAHQHLDFAWEELCDLAIMGFESAFLPFQEKIAMLEEVAEQIEALTEEAEQEG